MRACRSDDRSRGDGKQAGGTRGTGSGAWGLPRGGAAGLCHRRLPQEGDGQGWGPGGYGRPRRPDFFDPTRSNNDNHSKFTVQDLGFRVQACSL